MGDSFITWPIYTHGKNYSYPLQKWIGGVHN